jgi:archaellum component FlaC
MTNNNNEELRRVNEELNNIINAFNSSETSLYGAKTSIGSNLFEMREETVEEKVKRLILLLNKIEEQLNAVNSTLEKVLKIGRSTKNLDMCSSVYEKMQTVKTLTLKIQTARLNLSFYFV